MPSRYVWLHDCDHEPLGGGLGPASASARPAAARRRRSSRSPPDRRRRDREREAAHRAVGRGAEGGAATGILDHIQFAGYPVGARWEPDTGEVLPRLAELIAPAPALSPGSVVLALVLLAAVGLAALRRGRNAMSEHPPG